MQILALTLASGATLISAGATAQNSEEFFWDQDYELALARSAAPANVSAEASFWVLTPEGYQQVVEGTNGFNCLVLRKYSAIFEVQRDLFDWDGLQAPVCYDPVASEGGPMKEQFRRAELGLAGGGHDEIRDAIFADYANGVLPTMTGVSFGYMYSSENRLTPQAGHWHPHMMVYAPYYTNEMLGGNNFMTADPIVFEAGGTPRAVIAIAVDARDGHIEPVFD